MADYRRENYGSRPQPRQRLTGNTGPNEAQNIIRVSTNRNTRFWIYLAKIYLKRHKEVEFQSYSDGISSCVRVCENLERFGYATFTLVQTNTITVVRLAEQNPRNRNGEQKRLRRVRFTVKMEKTKNFEELTSNMRLD